MIDKLVFVLALAQEQHFGRAAETCGVTQPTLSAGLKSLEDTLGVMIVKRAARFQGFTPEGEHVLDWARRIVGDAKAMRQDLDLLKRGLVGHLKIAVIPTALPVVARLTEPLQLRHPGLGFTIISRPSSAIRLLENIEIDAGVSYLDNEPLGAVRAVPLFDERYCFLTAREGAFADKSSVTWADVGTVPLCLPTPDMQNRRIIDERLRAAGHEPQPTVVSDSTIVILSHVRTGRWSSILPPMLIDSIGVPDSVVSLPIVGPDVAHTVGLIVAPREPATHGVTALVAEARRLAREFGPQRPD